MAKDENKEQETQKKTRKQKPKYLYGLEIDAKGVLSEMEFDSKVAASAYLRENAKDSANKDGWIPLKGNRMLKIIHGRTLEYREVKDRTLI